jgi:hypothetical protein
MGVAVSPSQRCAGICCVPAVNRLLDGTMRDWWLNPTALNGTARSRRAVRAPDGGRAPLREPRRAGESAYGMRGRLPGSCFGICCLVEGHVGWGSWLISYCDRLYWALVSGSLGGL